MEMCVWTSTRHLVYEKVYVPLYQVTHTPFRIQGAEKLKMAQD